jgi:HlyD family secretion protein
VTTEAIATVVGNPDLARELAAGVSKIEVQAALAPAPETASGYRWTSGQGPDLRVSAGTSAALRVTVERRRPISYLIPALRDWSGL